MNNEPNYTANDKSLSPVQGCILSHKPKNELYPQIYALKWLKEDITIRDSKVLKKVTLEAKVADIPDGSTVSFSIKQKLDGEDCAEEIVTLSGTVKNKKVQVVWETEDFTKEETTQ